MASTPFPNSNDNFTSSSILQNSSNHFLITTILHITRAPADLSQIPHNPPRKEPHPPLSHITHHLSLTILHLFLSSNNPAEPVLSLNRNLTLSWPCTDLTYLSTPEPSFDHFNVLFVCTSSSQSFSFLALILFFNLPTAHPRYPVQSFSSKPYTHPTTLFHRPLLVSPPPSSPVDSLPPPPISYQTTLSSFPSFSPS